MTKKVLAPQETTVDGKTVSIFIHTYIYTYIHIYIHIHIHTHTHIYTYTPTYMCMYVQGKRSIIKIANGKPMAVFQALAKTILPRNQLSNQIRFASMYKLRFDLLGRCPAGLEVNPLKIQRCSSPFQPCRVPTHSHKPFPNQQS